MNQLYFRVAVIGQGAAGQTLFANGYKANDGAQTLGDLTNTATIKSLSQAITQCESMVRKLQSTGIDCRGEVHGRVFDTFLESDRLLSGLPSDGRQRPVTTNEAGVSVSNAIRDMAVGEGNEQIYCRLDTPERGLTTRINLSNRAAVPVELAYDLGGDVNEDTEDKDASEEAGGVTGAVAAPIVPGA